MHQVGRDDGQLQVFGNVDSVFRAIQTQNVGESLRGIAVGEVRGVARPRSLRCCRAVLTRRCCCCFKEYP